MKKMYFQNIECGNIFDFTECGYEEMMLEGAEMYDLGDPTNPATWEDYYRIIEA